MSEKPILFSAPMVRALLEGRKTQTRRVLKKQPPPECSIHYMIGNESWMPHSERTPLRHHWEAWRGPLYEARPEKAMAGSFEVAMTYTPGDLLWVRESGNLLREAYQHEPGVGDVYRDAGFIYSADGKIVEVEANGYDTPISEWVDECARVNRPSIFMPRWASRLTLEVTDVRVQRLQEISADDASAEGVDQCRIHKTPHTACFYLREAFAELWDSINAERGFGWDVNPWVAVISFIVHQQNVDALRAARAA